MAYIFVAESKFFSHYKSKLLEFKNFEPNHNIWCFTNPVSAMDHIERRFPAAEHSIYLIYPMFRLQLPITYLITDPTNPKDGKCRTYVCWDASHSLICLESAVETQVLWFGEIQEVFVLCQGNLQLFLDGLLGDFMHILLVLSRWPRFWSFWITPLFRSVIGTATTFSWD